MNGSAERAGGGGYGCMRGWTDKDPSGKEQRGHFNTEFGSPAQSGVQKLSDFNLCTKGKHPHQKISTGQ